jgi:hypothetical protein
MTGRKIGVILQIHSTWPLIPRQKSRVDGVETPAIHSRQSEYTGSRDSANDVTPATHELSS